MKLCIKFKSRKRCVEWTVCDDYNKVLFKGLSVAIIALLKLDRDSL